MNAASLRTVLPGGLTRMVVERNVYALKYSWLIIAAGFLEPVFYLFSIGIGVGALVGTVHYGGRQVDYATFVAPALMATSAMNGAIYDSTMNVYHKLRYAKLYDAMLAGPMTCIDVATGEISWALLRGLVYSFGFYLVMLAAGMVQLGWSILMIPAASLIGFAFAACGMAGTTFARGWPDLGYVELATMPLFLFSATFYPLSTYPVVGQWVVQATPLYHGVAMLRELSLGQVGIGLLAHVVYLLAMGLAGLLVVSRRLRVLLYS